MLRAQTSQPTLGSDGEGLSGHYAKCLVFDRQGILFLKVFTASHHPSDADSLIYIGQNWAASFVSEKCSVMDQGRETLWIPGREKQSCKAILFTEA